MLPLDAASMRRPCEARNAAIVNSALSSLNGGVSESVPTLESDRAVGHDAVMQVERGVGLGRVQAEVTAPGLASGQRAGGGQAGERVGMVEQALEAIGGALE